MNATKSTARWTVLLIAVAVAGCGSGEQPGSDAPAVASSAPVGGTAASSPSATARGVTYERARDVQEQRWQEIRQRYDGVQGVGITKVVGDLTDRARHTDPVWGIMVLIAGVPPTGRHSIDGVPLKFRMTGQFRQFGEP